VQKGFSVEVLETELREGRPVVIGTIDFKPRIDYVVFSVQPRWTFIKGTFASYVFGGPSFDLKVGNDSYSSYDELSNVVLAFWGGIGLEFHNFLAEFRYTHDLTSSWDARPEGTLSSLRNHGFLIFTGYSFEL
jgi:hypothetical protein